MHTLIPGHCAIPLETKLCSFFGGDEFGIEDLLGSGAICGHRGRKTRRMGAIEPTSACKSSKGGDMFGVARLGSRRRRLRTGTNKDIWRMRTRRISRGRPTC